MGPFTLQDGNALQDGSTIGSIYLSSFVYPSGWKCPLVSIYFLGWKYPSGPFILRVPSACRVHLPFRFHLPFGMEVPVRSIYPSGWKVHTVSIYPSSWKVTVRSIYPSRWKCMSGPFTLRVPFILQILFTLWVEKYPLVQLPFKLKVTIGFIYPSDSVYHSGLKYPLSPFTL